MTVEFRVGDVFKRLAEIPDRSVDLIVTSPPFLALRSYLPAGHLDKGKELGSEPDPAAFIDTLLALSAEWRRVLAPHGSLCVELGDTFSGSGGAGGDYAAEGLREGQERFTGSAERGRSGWHRGSRAERSTGYRKSGTDADSGTRNGGSGWPLDKSLAGIPHAFSLSLAYGWNVLDRRGPDSPAGRWRVRNILVWARPNPPVGALGDKFRPATSYITVACRGRQRWFDLDAVRVPAQEQAQRNTNGPKGGRVHAGDEGAVKQFETRLDSNPAGAPPLDWHDDLEDGSPNGHRLWVMPTQPYKGSHYACFPLELPRRLIEAMCPRDVCTACGEPRRRETERTNATGAGFRRNRQDGNERATLSTVQPDCSEVKTLGWSSCDCGAPFRPGLVLDPFGGSGTTGAAALALGRRCVLIDIDERNADLARERIGMFMTVDAPSAVPEPRPWVDVPLDFGGAA